MTDDEIEDALAQEIAGGSAGFDIFIWLEENPSAVESQACRVFDDHYFQCEDCSWTLPIGNMGETMIGVCDDCEEGY